jgi:glycosyltransferase involved in cell wall biosynthesis
MAVGLEFYAPYLDISGIAQTARELTIAMYDIGIPVKGINLPGWSNIAADLPNKTRQKIQLIMSAPIPDKSVFVNFMPPIKVNHLKDGAVANVISTIYETDRIPYVWAEIIKQTPRINEVWVPTEFNRASFIKGGIPENMLHVLPLGVDEKTYHPDVKPLNIKDRPGFVFLSVMDMKECKGFDVLLNAYLKEFSEKDDCCLILKAYSGGTDDKYKERVKQVIRSFRQRTSSTARLMFLGENVAHDKMVSLYRSADTFVLPTRGEGWSMGTIQSMACGVPTIMTDCSGHRTYMNETNGLLVKCEQKPIKNIPWLVREPNQAYHEWWEPSEEDLRKQMRYAYEHPKEMKDLGTKARQDILQWTWTKAAQKMANELVRLSGE